MACGLFTDSKFTGTQFTHSRFTDTQPTVTHFTDSPFGNYRK
jgi:hypothetical protein